MITHEATTGQRGQLEIDVARYEAWDTARQYPATGMFAGDYVTVLTQDARTSTVSDGEMTATIPRHTTNGSATVTRS